LDQVLVCGRLCCSRHSQRVAAKGHWIQRMARDRVKSSKSAGFLTRVAAFTAIVTCALVGVIHFIEVRSYYDHLASLPNEDYAKATTLQTENGFYFSYFREVVEGDSVAGALEGIVNDRRSEHPDVLNALRRFNVYQEVILGLVYRMLASFGFGSLVSAWDFFRNQIYAINGVGHSALALLAVEVSGNPLAGVLCYLMAFFNRFEISRLGNYTSLNLRESWAMPFLIMQTLCLFRLLRVHSGSGEARKLLWFAFFTTTFLFLVLWQFSPFLLLLQSSSLYFVYLVCGYRSLRPTVVGVINVYLVATTCAIIVHFGSPYLLTSPFLAEIIGLKIATLLCSRECKSQQPPSSSVLGTIFTWVKRRMIDVGEGLLAVACFGLVMKAMAPFSTADTHIYEIFCTKIPHLNNMLPVSFRFPASYLPECAEPSFNAQLYLIMGVFNFLDASSFEVYRKTTASPCAAVALACVLVRCVLGAFRKSEVAPQQAKDSRKPAPSSSEQEAHGNHSNGRPADGKESDATGLRKRKGGVDGSAKKGPTAKSTDTGSTGKHAKKTVSDGSDEVGDDVHEIREEAALLFFMLQTILFCCLGFIINRLRAVFGPFLMVAGSVAFGPRLFPLRWFLQQRHMKRLVQLGLAGLFFCHSCMLLSHLPCWEGKGGICDHISDMSSQQGDLVDLMDWMNKHVATSSPVLCSMNMAGAVRAWTDLPLIIHPQFESANLRKRVQDAYELYHCGTEDSFAKTMRKLNAKIVVFEYARCFITPYHLDDKRKNCNKKKHRDPEDVLCYKLHNKDVRHFKQIFGNGGYSVFELRDEPLPESEVSSKVQLTDKAAWTDFLTVCKSWGEEECGARLVELAAMWHHGVKKQSIARTIRSLAVENFPENGVVNYYQGRFLDYDANQGQQSGRWYTKAATLMPNNPIALKEYLMWVDMVAQDQQTMKRFLQLRMKDQGTNRSLINLGDPHLLCEASISATTVGLTKFGVKMWDEAYRLAPGSKCMRHNWQIKFQGANYSDVHSLWKQVSFIGSISHVLESHHGPSLRYTGETPYIMSPRVLKDQKAAAKR